MEGDRNSTFFYKSSSKNKKRNTIIKLLDDHNWELTKENDMGNWGSNYFHKICNYSMLPQDHNKSEELFRIIITMVDMEMNDDLLRKVRFE